MVPPKNKAGLFCRDRTKTFTYDHCPTGWKHSNESRFIWSDPCTQLDRFFEMLQWIRSNGRAMALLHSGRKYRNHTGRFDKGSGNYILKKRDYYMARKSWGKSIRLDWFLLGRDFATWIDSKETATSREILYSKFSKFHINRFGLGTV